MEAMNDGIRRAVRVSLAERDMSQSDLARAVGMKPQYMSELLTGKVGKIPTAWQKILDELGLELVALPKGSGQPYSGGGYGSGPYGGPRGSSPPPDEGGDS